MESKREAMRMKLPQKTVEEKKCFQVIALCFLYK